MWLLGDVSDGSRLGIKPDLCIDLAGAYNLIHLPATYLSNPSSFFSTIYFLHHLLQVSRHQEKESQVLSLVPSPSKINYIHQLIQSVSQSITIKYNYLPSTFPSFLYLI